MSGTPTSKGAIPLTRLPPPHTHTQVEALAQLSCCDAASAPPVISVAVGVALAVEAQHCELDSEHLLQLAR
jgi:hypothetical protein